MTKKKTMKNIKTPNKFLEGGISTPDSALGILSNLTAAPTLKTEGLQLAPVNIQVPKNPINISPNMKNAAGLLGGVAGGLISGGFSTIGGQVLSGIGDAAMMFNPLIGGAIKLASGLVNRGFGTKWDQAGIAEAENQISGLNTFQSGASDYDTLAQDFNRIGSMNKTIKASDLGEDGWFVDRTQTKANKLNTELGNAYNYAMRNANNVANNISNNTLANLERNYAAFGGPLFAYGGQTHGADFTNGLTFINNGGTHENNPYEGVPISMDQEGNPNLVEEGEVVWNDYVFSNRLKVPKSIQKKYKLGNREMTFANAVDKLSKESEERPNDPISMRGLESILMNMAIEQETLKSKQQSKNTKSNKFATGGPFGDATSPFTSTGKYIPNWIDAVNALTLDDYNRYLASKNLPSVTQSNLDVFKRGATDGKAGNKHNTMWNALNWLYDNKKLNIKGIEDITYNDYVRYLLGIGAPTVAEDVFESYKEEEKITQEVLDWLSANPETERVRHRIRIPQKDGTYTFLDVEAPWKGVNVYEGGRTWNEIYPYISSVGDKVLNYNDNGINHYSQYYDITDLEAFKAAHPNIKIYTKPETTDDEDPKETPYEQLPTWMRYAPVVGFGALALSDALGITNKPDYSNTDAIIRTVRDNATYDPIRFKPIGDYLTYNPFDTEYHANQLRAVAGANRRHIMNTSGGNRATAMAGILASDNNTMNQLGDLYRKAAEYNLEQRQKVADFNRATNMFNSEGFYKADAANQNAALQARGLGLEGLIKGYTMREQAKLMSDQARAANISGLFTNLGNIGYENANRNMANWSIANGTWAPSQWAYDPLTGKPIKSNQ